MSTNNHNCLQCIKERNNLFIRSVGVVNSHQDMLSTFFTYSLPRLELVLQSPPEECSGFDDSVN